MRRTRNRKKIINKALYWLGAGLMAAGLLVALYPTFQNVYYRYVQAEKLEEAMEEIENSEEEVEETLEENPSLLPEDNPSEYPDELPSDQEGLLEIPALDIKLMIGYGVETEDLKTGPGFYPESEHPETGNVSIAGHRTTYGAPFRHLDQLEEADEILLHYQDQTYVYQVDRVFDISDTDWSVIDPTPTPAVTLTTCHPPGSAARRLVVRAYQGTESN